MEDRLEELKKFAEEIPMDELFDEIRKLSGLSDLKFTYKIIERNDRLTIKFESQELVDKVGFLKLLFSSIIISQFNSEVMYREEDENHGYCMYWGSASFRYDHPDGGSNGHTFLYFSYTKDRGWDFR